MANLVPGSPYTPYMTYNFLLDEEVIINERECFTIVQALQGMGGFASIIFGFTRFFFSYIQRFLFSTKLVEKLILMEDKDKLI